MNTDSYAGVLFDLVFDRFEERFCGETCDHRFVAGDKLVVSLNGAEIVPRWEIAQLADERRFGYRVATVLSNRRIHTSANTGKRRRGPSDSGVGQRE
jgi:hypothetical protein